MRQRFNIFDAYYNEEDFILYPGRVATAAGIIGFLTGIIITRLTIYDIFTIVVIPILFGYAGLTGSWGFYLTNRWFMKYRYRMHLYLWYVLRIPVIAAGSVLGLCGWGLLEHFILLLAINARGGILGSQLVLLPIVGRKFAKLLRRSPLDKNPPEATPPYYIQQ